MKMIYLSHPYTGSEEENRAGHQHADYDGIEEFRQGMKDGKGDDT